MTPDAAPFDSPAVPLLATLEARGCRLTVTADGGRLIVEPASRLTADERRRVREHRRTLAELIRDDGLQARREVFAAQFAASLPPRVPAFLFKGGVRYRAGACFSCGDSLPEATFGRCWKCALAWRLAVGVKMHRETAIQNLSQLEHLTRPGT